MNNMTKVEKKINYLKKENNILKQLLKQINSMDLYEKDIDYDCDDNLIVDTRYFSIEEKIMDEMKFETNPETKNIKKNILKYIEK